MFFSSLEGHCFYSKKISFRERKVDTQIVDTRENNMLCKCLAWHFFILMFVSSVEICTFFKAGSANVTVNMIQKLGLKVMSTFQDTLHNIFGGLVLDITFSSAFLLGKTTNDSYVGSIILS